ncbi:MAG: co-chaperone GroES [Clostridia bacterium]|nr:co-chaperone GroES [Clostridia bacterium]MCL6522413.1 co-chaperone GroES [Bacillota bacterium]
MSVREASKVRLRPLGDRIVVRVIEQEERTPSGIVLPDTAKEKPQEGEVLAVGKGAYLENGQIRPLDVQVGQHVLFSKYSGTEVKIDGEEYLVLSERDVLAVVER